LGLCSNPPSSPYQIQTTENMEGRIVGGVEAKKHEFPWVVRLQYKSTGGLLCGGSIISPRSILTAAHCLRNPASDLLNLEVLAGAHDMNNSTGEPRQVRALKNITCHRGYNGNNMQNDVCILSLTSDLQMTQWVSFVEVADTNTKIPGSGVVAGWGITTENGVVSRVLRKVSVPMVSNPTCSNAYSVVPGISITNGMMCAGTSGKDSCQGDSGGPLMCTYDANNTPVLFACGIVSFGVGCGDARFPGVYTRISTYRDWIYAIDNSTQFVPMIAGVSTGVVLSVWTTALSIFILAITK